MGKINVGRLILGGLVAGIVSDILGFLVDGIWLAPRWNEGLKALNHGDMTSNQWIWFSVLGLVTGLVLLWIYAGIRPRFGAGVKTAICAGVIVWVLSVLIPNIGFMWVDHFFSRRLTAYTTACGLVEIVVGAIAGAALYKESAS